MSFKKFFKSLTVRLAIGSILTAVSIILAFVLRSNSVWSIVFSVLALIFICVINFWFRRDVIRDQ